MADEMIRIRNARSDEVAILAEVEGYCWPNGLAATAEFFGSRIRTYTEGQWIAELGGEVVAVASSQRISENFLASGPVRYDILTDRGRFTRSHDPRGEVLHLVSVSVLPGVRGFGVGRKLVDHEIAVARALAGVQRIIGITRPRRFSRHPGMSIEEYVAARTENGSFIDPVISFHLGSGARLVSIHAGYRPEDTDAGGYGVMVEYNIQDGR
ncbi:MAG: GNAT family N-acetyltransferase [Planctomycetota bacterium]